MVSTPVGSRRRFWALHFWRGGALGARQQAWMVNGAPGEIRTPDPRIRSPMLYPAELRARVVVHHAEKKVPFRWSGSKKRVTLCLPGFKLLRHGRIYDLLQCFMYM